MYKPGHWVSFQGLCTARTDFSLFSLAARPLGFRPHRLKAVDRLTDSQGCRGAHTALLWEEQVSRWCGAQGGRAQREGTESATEAPSSSSNGAWLLWQPGFPPQVFRVAHFLIPVPSGYLLAANISLLPGFALQTSCSSPQSL